MSDSVTKQMEKEEIAQKESLEFTTQDFEVMKTLIDLLQQKGGLKIEEVAQIYPLYDKIKKKIEIK